VFLSLISPAAAQEWPYFITYSHDMEEPGNLEINLGNVAGNPQMGNRFVGSALEFEYGVKTWWTTEFYLDGQITQHDSTIFTGYRWENRFRPLLREHWINPVIYIEFENITNDLINVFGAGSPEAMEASSNPTLEGMTFLFSVE